MSTKISCDQCKRTLPRPTISLTSHADHDSGMAVVPAVPYGTYDFCSRDCLSKWIEATKVCPVVKREEGKVLRCDRPAPHVVHEWVVAVLVHTTDDCELHGSCIDCDMCKRMCECL